MGLIIKYTSNESRPPVTQLDVVAKNGSDHCSSPPVYLLINLSESDNKSGLYRYHLEGGAQPEMDAIEEKVIHFSENSLKSLVHIKFLKICKL